MKIIWGLYDDGNCSYKKAIEEHFNGQYEVHCVGINDRPFEDTQYYKYHKIDLSILNRNLIKELSKLPKPDIILASPPCESWSIADTIKTYKNNSILLNNQDHYIQENNKFLEAGHKQMYRNFFDKQRTRLLGEATVMAIDLVLQVFQPKIWVIENPASSRSWLYQKEFLGLIGFENKTYYNNYDWPYAKPTIFKSNMQLNLKCERIKSQIAWKDTRSYDGRSSIPSKLIADIITQIEGELCKQK